VESLKSRLADRHPGLSTALRGPEIADGGSGSNGIAGQHPNGSSAATGAAVNSSDSDLLAWIDGLAQVCFGLQHHLCTAVMLLFIQD